MANNEKILSLLETVVNKVSQLEAELAGVRAELVESKAELAGAKSDLSRARVDLANIKADQNTAKNSAFQAEAKRDRQMDGLNERCAALHDTAKELREAIEAAREQQPNQDRRLSVLEERLKKLHDRVSNKKSNWQKILSAVTPQRPS